jgi:beta-glucosidase
MTTGLEQNLNIGSKAGELAVPSIIPLARAAAAEGIVLLKNENRTLPIKPADKVAVFGRVAINYFAVGYGSGGDVRRPYAVNLIDGLRSANVNIDESLHKIYAEWTSIPENVPDENCGWGKWPMNFPEMPLTEPTVRAAAKNNDMAVVVIGRAAGEARENVLEDGSYYLTDVEKDMLALVTAAFSRVAVVMNCGNIIDMAWTNDYEIGAIVYAWQGGMDSGNAAADVLTGAVNPSGKMPSTIAKSYDLIMGSKDFGGESYNEYSEDIYVGYRYFTTFAPSDALYPFGYGLSYTSFEVSAVCETDGTAVIITADTTNTGNKSGKTAVQAYLSCPCGLMGKPAKVLAAFAKSSVIEPGSTERVNLSFDIADFASYDDSGATGHKSAYVLEKGDYVIYVGDDITNLRQVSVYSHPETTVVRQLSEVMAVKPENVFMKLKNDGGASVYEPAAVATTDLKQIILDRLPEEIPFTGDVGIKLRDVKEGKYTLEQFIAQLTPEELDNISRGEGKMDSKLGVAGNAGAFGGITDSLREKGIPPVITTDGPSGIRIHKTCSLLPCGTALASTFNTPLTEELYAALSLEMRHHGTNVLLAPGMNIHRNPLCGRNFEYFSEDPLLCGKMAAAAVRGIQSNGGSACPKHFAANNQETNRNTHDSRVSERALREIYLKCFETAVKESNPHTIMTSYNKINGVWSHYGYELVTTVLRDEWGYEGLVMTDWWMHPAASPEFPNLTNDAYRVRAQVDVLMPGGDNDNKKTQNGRTLLDTYGQADGITLGEMQRTAKNVLAYIVRYIL